MHIDPIGTPGDEHPAMRSNAIAAGARLRRPSSWRLGAAAMACIPLFLAAQAHARSSFVDMQVFGSNEGPVLGASTLKRYDDRVDFSIHTTDLEPGHAYTVWLVIFNNPDACSDERGQDDFPPGVPGAQTGDDEPDPAVAASSLWAAGTLVGADGTASFFGRAEVGNPPGMVSFGPGLEDPMGAEIHMVVRSHGRALIGEVAEQISTSQGLCTVTKPDPSSNLCLDVQAATHIP
jgi:hypothetical protein